MTDLLVGQILSKLLVRTAVGDLNCLFVQDEPFIRDGDRAYTAPFTCYPPFAGGALFNLSRGRLIITADAASQLNALGSPGAAVHSLGVAVARKLGRDLNCTELVIEVDDLVKAD